MNLQNTGFKPPSKARQRIIAAIDGLEKRGKTHLALTAPGPIAIQSTDIGTEGVIDKFMSDKEILVAEYSIDVRGKGAENIAAEADQLWKKYVRDYHTALDQKVRTVVWDTATETWELLRLARFGKLDQVMPHHYGPVNREYRELIRDAFDADTNLILLHKLKEEWKEGSGGKANRTGNYERSGFKETGFMAQINIRCEREMDDDGNVVFYLQIDDCRQNAMLTGQRVDAPMNTIPFLATMIYPDTDISEWM